MAERAGLENRCTRKGTVGSNPTSSASQVLKLKPFLPRAASPTRLASFPGRAEDQQPSRHARRMASHPQDVCGSLGEL